MTTRWAKYLLFAAVVLALIAFGAATATEYPLVLKREYRLLVRLEGGRVLACFSQTGTPMLYEDCEIFIPSRPLKCQFRPVAQAPAMVDCKRSDL